jgi:hypothetical protein
VIGELVHAWSDRGLDGDGPGYVVVARTSGLRPSVGRIVESRSGHRVGTDLRPTIALRRAESVEGPVAMLTATAPIRDAEGTGTRIAHHLVFDDEEVGSMDPVAKLAAWRPLHRWSGPSRELPALSRDEEPVEPRPCAAWEAASGDAGWAGEAISRLRSLGGSMLVVRFAGAIDARSLFIELASLLPRSERASLTFADRLRRNDPVALVLLDDQAVAIAEIPLPGGTALLDLSAPRPSPEHGLAHAARSGAIVEPPSPRAAPELGVEEPIRLEDAGEPWSRPIEVTLAAPASGSRSSLAWLLVALAIVSALAWMLWSGPPTTPEGSP